MAIFGAVERGYLGKFIATAPKTLFGLADMRGYDWSAAPHDPRLRPTYYEDHVLKVDFSNSKADEGFEVRGTVFEECVFDKSVWWLMVFVKCQFLKCSFNNCRLYNSRFNGKFYDCSFKDFSTKGEGFSFGWGSEYKHCNFESVTVRNLNEEVGVRFEDCVISGLFTNGIFRGRRYALRERFASLPDLLFSTFYRPVAFIGCDLSGLKTENFVFEKDVIFKDSTVDSQSLFG
jgi:uncharacterized protein YjbI with pentapeptide repeats